MWHRKINVVSVKSFSLIEILISLTLGSFVLLVASNYYSTIIVKQNHQRDIMILQQHTHQLLAYFQHHIQHLGYQGKTRDNSNYDLLKLNNNAYFMTPNCITFFYDANQDGCIGKRKGGKTNYCNLRGKNNITALNEEVFGFRVENRILYAYHGKNSIQHCYQTECKALLANCHSKEGWRSFSDQADYLVETLNISWLKQDEIIKIELVLSSTQNQKIQYQSYAYIPLFNKDTQ